MNVGEAARRSGLPSKTLRYYDEIGLVSPARADSGYRSYSEGDVHRLRFVHRARRLGFPIEDCRLLLSLYGDEGRASREVKRIAQQKLVEIDRRMEELRSIRRVLGRLAASCDGDERPACPILDELGADEHGPIDDIAGDSRFRG